MTPLELVLACVVVALTAMVIGYDLIIQDYKRALSEALMIMEGRYQGDDE
jgi:hypothetical protein